MNKTPTVTDVITGWTYSREGACAARRYWQDLCGTRRDVEVEARRRWLRLRQYRVVVTVL